MSVSKIHYTICVMMKAALGITSTTGESLTNDEPDHLSGICSGNNQDLIMWTITWNAQTISGKFLPRFSFFLNIMRSKTSLKLLASVGWRCEGSQHQNFLYYIKLHKWSSIIKSLVIHQSSFYVKLHITKNGMVTRSCQNKIEFCDRAI